MMFCPNSSSRMNPTNEALIRLNGWSQVVPICMPWATPTATPTTTPINNPIITAGIDINRNVMQFTANRHPFNFSMNPQMVDTNSCVIPPVMHSVMSSGVPIEGPIPQRYMDEETAIKSQIVCPDPCTSQTATRWELLNNISRGNHSSHKHLKRRNDSSDEEIDDELRTPIKQHINEDKVSAIFNRLQITNQSNNDLFDFNDTIECEEFEDQTNESKNSIIFADELQSAIKSKTITDRLVQNELDKHSKAVVLWQPITPLYPPIGQTTDSNQEDCPNDKSDDNSIVSQNGSNDLDIDVIDCNDFDNEMELCL